MAYLGFDPQISSTSYRNIDDISASFDGLVTTFPLRVGGVVPGIAPINEQQVLINVGGVPQQPDPSGVNGFKLSAGNIVFSSAPSIGEKFWGVILAGVDRVSAGVSYPDGSVTTPSITFDAQNTAGLYRSGSNQLAVALNGINPVTFTTSGLRLNGATSGTVTLAAPSAAGGNTLTLPTGNGSAYQILRNGATAGSLEFADKLVLGTAVPTTSGTSVPITGIPSWAKRVTVMCNNVTTNGTSYMYLRVGAGSIQTTSYYTFISTIDSSGVPSFLGTTDGFVLPGANAGDIRHASYTLTKIEGNTWMISGTSLNSGSVFVNAYVSGLVAVTGTLDRISLTTVGGVNTFAGGSLNIMYE